MNEETRDAAPSFAEYMAQRNAKEVGGQSHQAPLPTPLMAIFKARGEGDRVSDPLRGQEIVLIT